MPYDADFSVLVFGATGYVGGSLLVGIKAKYPAAKCQVLVRSAEHDGVLRSAVPGLDIVHAKDDLSVVKSLAGSVDVVVQAANPDDPPFMTAIIEGMADRSKRAGRRPILLHISGMASVLDNAQGAFDPNTKYINDANEDDIKNIPPSAIHRHVDLLVMKADEEKRVNAYIVSPSVIFGEGSGPIRRNSGTFPVLVGIAKAFGRPAYVGEGTSVVGTVHIDDTVDLTLLVLARALAEQDLDVSPYTKFYQVTTGEISNKELMSAIATVLYKQGIYSTADVQQLSFAEAVSLSPYSVVISRNWLGKSDRSLSIGWKPKRLESIVAEIDRWIAPTLV